MTGVGEKKRRRDETKKRGRGGRGGERPVVGGECALFTNLKVHSSRSSVHESFRWNHLRMRSIRRCPLEHQLRPESILERVKFTPTVWTNSVRHLDRVQTCWQVKVESAAASVGAWLIACSIASGDAHPCSPVVQFLSIVCI